MPWSVIIPAAASLIGGAMQSDAAGDAADQQVQATERSIEEQRRQYDTTRADNAQFLQTGVAANKRLAHLLGLSGGSEKATGPLTADQVQRIYQTYMGRPVLADELASVMATNSNAADLERAVAASPEHSFHVNTQRNVTAPVSPLYESETSGSQDGEFGSLLRKFSAADLEADPVYQSGLKFGLDRGTEGINARATANGMYDSGATLKALTQFGNDYGSTKANESYNRFNNDQSNIYSRLTGSSGAGQVAAGSNASAGSAMAGNIGSSLEGAGNARAAGVVGGANAWGNAASGVNTAYNNYMQNERFKQLFPGGSNYTGYGSGYVG